MKFETILELGEHVAEMQEMEAQTSKRQIEGQYSLWDGQNETL